MKNVIVLASAADDLEQARLFYEGQEPGLGEQCVDSILADLGSLAQLSGIHPLHHRHHQMLEMTFHLGIYYREERQDTLVVAILDLRRDPSWIRKKLRRVPD